MNCKKSKQHTALRLSQKSMEWSFFIIMLGAWIIAVGPFIIPIPQERSSVAITTAKKTYLHFEFISLQGFVKGFNLRDACTKDGIRIQITRNGSIVKGIGGRDDIILSYNIGTGRWEGEWPCPWNAPEDEYLPVMVVPDGWEEHITVDSDTFVIRQRPLSNAVPPGFAAMTYETNVPLKTVRLPLVEGGTGEWPAIFDWCAFTGVDALWILGGQTAYFTKPLRPDFPWLEYNLPLLPALGIEAHRRGLQLGAYVMAYLTFGERNMKPPQYEYAIDYNMETDVLFETRSISLRDVQRKNDIIAILSQISAVREIDFIGLDYIRNALGGYELVNEFVDAMGVSVPLEWPEMVFEERMKWLAKKKIIRKDVELIDQWQWWRAHVTGTIVDEIKAALNTAKPFWVFTLSWELGWQHGQDPVMMNDAGADIDAIMLYEADAPQYNDLLKQWRSYVSSADAQVIVGDVIDWPLHQKTLDPAGPEDYLGRNTRAIKKIYTDGPSHGVFLHDLDRLLKGRHGPYARIEWALAGAASVSYCKELYGIHSIIADVRIPEDIQMGQNFTVSIDIQRLKSSTEKITCTVFHSPGLNLPGSLQWTDLFNGSNTIHKELYGEVVYPYGKRGGRHFIALHINWFDNERTEHYSTIRYFTVDGVYAHGAYTAENAPTAGSGMPGHITVTYPDMPSGPLLPGTTWTAGNHDIEQ